MNIFMVKIKILWSTLKIRWGCSLIAPPFLPPMSQRVVRTQSKDDEDTVKRWYKHRGGEDAGAENKIRTEVFRHMSA